MSSGIPSLEIRTGEDRKKREREREGTVEEYEKQKIQRVFFGSRGKEVFLEENNAGHPGGSVS